MGPKTTHSLISKEGYQIPPGLIMTVLKVWCVQILKSEIRFQAQNPKVEQVLNASW